MITFEQYVKNPFLIRDLILDERKIVITDICSKEDDKEVSSSVDWQKKYTQDNRMDILKCAIDVCVTNLMIKLPLNSIIIDIIVTYHDLEQEQRDGFKVVVWYRLKEPNKEDKSGWVIDSMTGDKMWTDQLTPTLKARNLAIEVRDMLELPRNQIEVIRTLEKVDEIINLLQ